MVKQLAGGATVTLAVTAAARAHYAPHCGGRSHARNTSSNIQAVSQGPLHALAGLVLLEDARLRRFEDAVEPTEQRERQDDLAVVGLLEVTSEQIGCESCAGCGLPPHRRLELVHRGGYAGARLIREQTHCSVVPARWQPEGAGEAPVEPSVSASRQCDIEVQRRPKSGRCEPESTATIFAARASELTLRVNREADVDDGVGLVHGSRLDVHGVFPAAATPRGPAASRYGIEPHREAAL